MARLLRAKYYSDGDLFNASLGSRPSYTWRGLMSARRIILCGSRWLVGDGHTVNVYDDHWLPHPISFGPITPKTDAWANLKESDHTSACWRESLVWQVFLDCDLCSSWLPDKLIWHFHPQDFFSVRSAYHMLITDSQAGTGASSSNDNSLWRAVWNCHIPSQIKLFGWRATIGIFPLTMAISKRIPNFFMSCSIFAHIEESDTHAILEWPLAFQIWQGNNLRNPCGRPNTTCMQIRNDNGAGTRRVEPYPYPYLFSRIVPIPVPVPIGYWKTTPYPYPPGFCGFAGFIRVV